MKQGCRRGRFGEAERATAPVPEKEDDAALESMLKH